MEDSGTERLRQSVKERHGGDPVHLKSVYVCELFKRATVWEGTVEVFELHGHPTMRCCYAWTTPDDQIAIICESPRIRNASDAVRAFIEAT